MGCRIVLARPLTAELLLSWPRGAGLLRTALLRIDRLHGFGRHFRSDRRDHDGPLLVREVARLGHFAFAIPPGPLARRVTGGEVAADRALPVLVPPRPLAVLLAIDIDAFERLLSGGEPPGEGADRHVVLVFAFHPHLAIRMPAGIGAVLDRLTGRRVGGHLALPPIIEVLGGERRLEELSRELL